MGPAHPAVGRVVGYTPFLLWFSCIFLIFLFIFLIFICLPCAPACLGSPGWVFYAWVTRDVTGDLVHLWVPLPRHARALSATCLVVSTLACIASSDRHSVALALSSSL